MKLIFKWQITDVNSGYESIHFYDETNDYVYYTSTESKDNTGKGVSRIRHLWRVKGYQIKYIEYKKIDT